MFIRINRDKVINTDNIAIIQDYLPDCIRITMSDGSVILCNEHFAGFAILKALL